MDCYSSCSVRLRGKSSKCLFGFGYISLPGPCGPLFWILAIEPAYEVLCVILAFSQNSTKSLDVYWLPWSLCRIKVLLMPVWDLSAFATVRTARSAVIFLSVMLATTVRS